MHFNRRKFSLTRRQFISRTILTGMFAGLGVGAYSFIGEPNWRRIKRYDFKSAKWPESHLPVRASVIADLHVGCPSVSLEMLKKIVNEVNGLNSDIILLLGDFLIAGVALGEYTEPEPIADILARLKAPLGTYSVLGNHDWWKDGPGIWKALERAGIKVLENDAVLVRRPDARPFWIAGLADDTTRAPNIGETLAKADTEDPVILMSHDPAPFLEMSQRPVITLAGHTHGGQVALPFIGPIIIPGRSPLRYAYGHINERGCDMIVSCGVGTSILPVRFNRRPEILTLNIGAA